MDKAIVLEPHERELLADVLSRVVAQAAGAVGPLSFRDLSDAERRTLAWIRDQAREP